MSFAPLVILLAAVSASLWMQIVLPRKRARERAAFARELGLSPSGDRVPAWLPSSLAAKVEATLSISGGISNAYSGWHEGERVLCFDYLQTPLFSRSGFWVTVVALEQRHPGQERLTSLPQTCVREGAWVMEVPKDWRGRQYSPKEILERWAVLRTTSAEEAAEGGREPMGELVIRPRRRDGVG